MKKSLIVASMVVAALAACGKQTPAPTPAPTPPADATKSATPAPAPAPEMKKEEVKK